MKRALILLFFAFCLLPIKIYGEDSDGVYSFRAELLQSADANGIGGVLEAGGIGENGFYFSMEFGLGANYLGSGFNIGGTFNKDGNIKNVLGVTMGAWNTKSYYQDSDYNYHKHNNFSFGGVFWKIMFGKQRNFDITNKLLLGSKDV